MAEAIRSDVTETDRRNSAGGQQQYLTFVLGGEMYALEILCIREIIEYGHLTTVPMMPAFVRGVINLRGSVVPVIDLAARFGQDRAAVHRRTCIVIVELEADGEPQEMGIVVDSVSEVLDIQPNDVEPAPSFGSRVRADFIRGMGKVNSEFVIILDVSRVLSLEEMAVLAQTRNSVREPAEETSERTAR